MAVRKFFLAIGQSNAAPTAYASSWYAYHPEQDLRLTPNFTFGSYSDTFTLPGSWPSNISTNLNLRGRAMQSIKFLTMYNPLATGYLSYPGYAKIAAVDATNPTTDIITNQLYSSSFGATAPQIVRKRTGTTHTLSSPTTTVVAGVGTCGKVTVSPALDPAPSVNEEFALQIRASSAASGTNIPITTKFSTFLGSPGPVASLVGLELEYQGPTHSGLIGTRKKITAVNATTGELTIESAFSSNPASGDLFAILPPKFEGVAIPIDKWGYFLPWSPFEGQVTQATYQPSGKTNPYPYGFNFPNHYGVPGFYWNPFNATPYISTDLRMSFAPGLAAKLGQAIGEDIYCVPLAVGGSGLAYTERGDANTFGGAWFDPTSNNHWAPGESGSLYNRLLDTLDAAKIAAAQQGDTLDCVGVFMIQGEQDASNEAVANAYYDNLKAFKLALRNAIYSKGLASLPAHKIPWVSSNIYEFYYLAATVNNKINDLAREDHYMETFDVQDVGMQDSVHFSGAGLTDIEVRCLEAWKRIQNAGVSDIDICNLALAHIGETASITSIYPTDGSVQSEHCARFYPIARDGLLQMHSWLFATRRKTLDATTNYLTQWQYAYLMPEDAGDAFSIIPPDGTTDYPLQYDAASVLAYGQYMAKQYAVEVNDAGQRIIYTNQENAVIRYTAKITDATKFSPLFVTALSWHLASMLAGPIIKGEVGSTEAKRCQQMTMLYLGKAQQTDSGNRNIKQDHVVSWISGR